MILLVERRGEEYIKVPSLRLRASLEKLEPGSLELVNRYQQRYSGIPNWQKWQCLVLVAGHQARRCWRHPAMVGRRYCIRRDDFTPYSCNHNDGNVRLVEEVK